MSDDLVTWLRGVLDEIEAGQGRRRKLVDHLANPGRYDCPECGDWVESVTYEIEQGAPVVLEPCRHEVPYDAAFMPNPYQAVLADVAAKRAILELHAPRDVGFEGDPRICWQCEDRGQHDAMHWPCPTVRLLASAYRDRPGYRQEWAP